MEMSRAACSDCGALNPPLAEWCARCFTRLAAAVRPRETAPASVAPVVAGSRRSIPLRKIYTGARLLLFGIFIASRFLNISIAGDAPVVPGRFDPRGFQPLLADAVTGEPVRFNACEPIHYVANPANAPAGALDDAHDAFETISRATGLSFVYDGTSTETFSNDRAIHQPDRYGDRWAPILVTWSSQPLHYKDEMGMEQGALGLAGPDYVINEAGRAVYVSGTATFDATHRLSSGRGGAWRQVMLHEIGHVVGLDHVDYIGSIMYTGPAAEPGELGDGDRAGLWALGLGSGCVETPPVP